jgi:hypothetical protein
MTVVEKCRFTFYLKRVYTFERVLFGVCAVTGGKFTSSDAAYTPKQNRVQLRGIKGKLESSESLRLSSTREQK